MATSVAFDAFSSGGFRQVLGQHGVLFQPSGTYVPAAVVGQHSERTSMRDNAFITILSAGAAAVAFIILLNWQMLAYFHDKTLKEIDSINSRFDTISSRFDTVILKLDKHTEDINLIKTVHGIKNTLIQRNILPR